MSLADRDYSPHQWDACDNVAALQAVAVIARESKSVVATLDRRNALMLTSATQPQATSPNVRPPNSPQSLTLTIVNSRNTREPVASQARIHAA
jgi:hypothetical protein